MGREREQTILRDHLAAAIAGHGNVVLIGGEAGIGKTALAETICCEAVAQGAFVLVGRCYDLTETPPYGPWVDLFGRYQPTGEMPPLPAAFAQRGTIGVVTSQVALFQQVLAFLTALAAQRPLVLLLDDAHWADPASLDLLRVVARSLATLPLLLVATYRSDELTRHHPLYEILPALVRESSASRLLLRALHSGDITTLVQPRYSLPDADVARLVGYLAARSEGNPFFLGELLRTLEEEGALRQREGGWMLDEITSVQVPSLLRQVIDARIARLGEEPRALLAIAAVIGQEIALTVWSSVAGVKDESLLAVLERASEAHIMEATPEDTNTRFVHALVRETLYASIVPPRRRLWHQRAADALITSPHPDPDAVAYHLQRAGDDRAVAWLVQTGERAERAHAWLTASDRYRAAAALIAAREPVEAGWLLVSVAWLRRWADVRGSIATLSQAERLAHDTGDAVLAAAVLHYRGILRCRMGDYRAGLAELREGVAGLDGLHAVGAGTRLNLTVADDHQEVRGYAYSLAMWLAFAGYLQEAIAVGERVVAHISAAPDVWERDNLAQGNLFFTLGLAYGEVGRIAEARAAYARTRDFYHDVRRNLPGTAQSAWHELVWLVLPCHTENGEEQDRLAAIATEAWAQASGALPTDDPPHVERLPIMVLRGQWSEAREIGRRVRASGAHMEHRFVGIGTIATLAQHQGEPDLAWALIRDWLTAGPTAAPGTARFHDARELHVLAVALALDQGDRATARVWLEAHDRWLTWSGAVLGKADGALGWARYHHAAGDATQARVYAENALALAMEPRQPLALLAAHRIMGELDTDAGHHANATAHFDAALALAEACNAPYERALTLLAHATLFAAVKDRAAALSALTEARSVFRQLDAIPALARANALAAKWAVATERSGFPDGLTEREVEVLRLIAAGMSNQRIAAALFISTRTVNRHIENIYRKIDAHGKPDATAYAFRHHLT